MRFGKVVFVVIGIFLALMSFALIVGGATLLWAYGTQRDGNGYFTSRTYDFTSEWSAITTEDLSFGAEPGDWWPARDMLTLKLSASGDEPVFVGIGPRDDVDAYLGSVGRAVIDDVNPFDSTPDLEVIPGPAPAAPPGDQGFWTVSASGEGTQTVTWDVAPGEWTAVLMNADGSEGISADVVAGARVAFIPAIAIGMLVVGVLLGVAAAALLVAGFRRPRTGEAAAPDSGDTAVGVAATGASGIAAGVGAHAGSYPARVEGTIEPGLSRWLWLVKWLLAIPHFVILGFLFVAFFVTTIVAGIVILFTTHYPRGLFDFNVGVMRWGWRVSFYCTSPVATDAYPPFTLEATDYPATFDVDYPEQLNRWLPLVKWFLAIPHLIIVGLFTNGLVWWAGDLSAAGGDEVLRIGGGLIAILTFIALVVLLFSGRYPQGIFELVMGMERWTYRTLAYVGLMTDDYPPFRLDMGGSEGESATRVGPHSPS